MRRTQWVGSFRDVVDEVLKLDEDRQVIRYIGLPGSDLIDIALFAEACHNRGRKLHYFGFDRTAGTSTVESVYLNIARELLLRSDKVHRDSIVMPDDFVALSNRKSLAYQRANEMSYDVVNLDFCGGEMNDAAGAENSFFSAVRNLLQIQSKREAPWLLLLTNVFDRAGLGTVGHSNVGRMHGALRDRLSACGMAREEAFAIFGGAEKDGMTIPELPESDSELYVRMHVAAFICWLSTVGKGVRSAHYKVLSAMAYKLRQDRAFPNMYSLAIRINPKELTVEDPARLLPAPLPADACGELSQHIRQLGRSRDADRMLTDNRDLFNEVREEMATILERLQYDRAEYLGGEFSRLIEDA